MHEEAIRKADVLIEALGYIRKFHGCFTVIKLGGSVMEDPEALRALLVDVVFMETVGMRPVVVHGGGKAITVRWSGRGSRPGSSRAGATPTTPRSRSSPRVLAEEINADIVRHITKYGGRAVGLHHRSTQCLFGRKLTLPGPDGRRGRPGPRRRGDRRRGRRRSRTLCLAGVVPVLPSLAEDDDGGLLNVNADTAAAAVAGT